MLKHKGTKTQDEAQDLHFVGPVNFSSNATVLGLRSAPTEARNTPSAHVIGVRPVTSLTSNVAPFSTRYLMISSDPRFAAPMIAFIPIEFTAFTSAPCSKQI